MRISGEYVLQAPVDQVWTTVLDPGVLVRAIPGCEQLSATGENVYAMTVTAGVAAIKGTYGGTCVLKDLNEPHSLVMHLQGSGAPGTIGATVDVRFTDAGNGATTVSYDADAVVGGMVGGVGQRMLTSVSKRMAGEFFGNLNDILGGAVSEPATAAGGVPAVGAAAPGEVAQVFTRAAAAGGEPGTGTRDYVKGVLAGAGLVLLGVVVGGILGRRR